MYETRSKTTESRCFGKTVNLVAEGNYVSAAEFFQRIYRRTSGNAHAAEDIICQPYADCARKNFRSNREAAVNIETETNYSIAKMALENGRFDVSLKYCHRIFDLNPDYPDALWCLAEANYGIEEKGEALKWYRRYLDKYPEDAQAGHMVAALGSGTKPARASDEYIREIFNNFADDFDRYLVEDLDYKVPHLLYALFKTQQNTVQRHLDILDVGCGTGLAGLLFRPYARVLTGVDLSPGMLQIARDRNIYDVLLEEELGFCMSLRRAEFDLVIAADVFCYIGDLTKTFKAITCALKPNGRVLFSVETQPKRGFALTDSGRYTHKPAYIRKVAKKAGLEEIIARRNTLRTEYGNPVEGYLVMLRKPFYDRENITE